MESMKYKVSKFFVSFYFTYLQQLDIIVYIITYSTVTTVSIDFICTASTVEAWGRRAFLNVHFAGDALEPCQTEAEIPIYYVQTTSSIHTRSRTAFVEIDVTIRAYESRRTTASKTVHSVHTCGTILAGIVPTVVDVYFAEPSSKSCGTITAVARFFFHTHRVIGTVVLRTEWYKNLAVFSSVSLGAIT